jgi:methylmalonyl-CoA mutase cobalamin-binding subunit
MLDVNDAVVHVETLPGDMTRVRVRIGTFSTDEHKRRASLILESVGNRVG